MNNNRELSLNNTEYWDWTTFNPSAISISIGYWKAIKEMNYQLVASFINRANPGSLEVYPSDLQEEGYITKELKKKAYKYLPILSSASIDNDKDPVDILKMSFHNPDILWNNPYILHPKKLDEGIVLRRVGINNPLWFKYDYIGFHKFEDVDRPSGFAICDLDDYDKYLEYLDKKGLQNVYLVTDIKEEDTSPYRILEGWFNQHPNSAIYINR
jgi:hypothetical protein